MEDFVNLKVGGCLYQASLTTLTNRRGTMLANMFSERIPSKKDRDGNYLIDGDGPIFRYILNFLRRSCLCLPEDFKEWDLLKTEADFYQIRDLITAVDLLYEDRRERKKREVEEIEFIKICTKRATLDNLLITSYRGPFNILKEIEPLFFYYQQFVYCHHDEYQLIEEAIEEVLVNTNKKEIDDDGDSFQEENVKKLDPMAIFQIVTQHGFCLMSTSTLESTKDHTQIQMHLFGRTVKK